MSRREESDVSIRGAFWFALILTVVVGTIGASIWLGLKAMEQRRPYGLQPDIWSQQSSFLAGTGPRLQTKPADDLARLRAGEDAVLGSYGWVDREHGVARIPIERAMDHLAEKGGTW